MKHVVAVKDTWGLKKGTGASGLKFSLFLLAAGLCFLLFFYLFCLSPFFHLLILPLLFLFLGTLGVFLSAGQGWTKERSKR